METEEKGVWGVGKVRGLGRVKGVETAFKRSWDILYKRKINNKTK